MGFFGDIKDYFQKVNNVEANIYTGKQDYIEIYEKNIQLEKEITKRTEELDIANKRMLSLRHIYDMMNSSCPLSNVLNKIVNTLYGDLGYLHCDIAQRKQDDKGYYLNVIAHSDSDLIKNVNAVLGMPIGDWKINCEHGGYIDKILKEGKIYCSTDLSSLLNSGMAGAGMNKIDTLLDTSFANSFILVPLHSTKGIWGLMAIFSPRNELAEKELGFLELFAQQIEQAITIAELFQVVREQAVTDSLTGLYNRRYFEEYTKKEAMRALRQNLKFSVIGLDLDHLKKINDKYGHSYGDIAIKTIAEVLKTNARSIDVAARMGGEEFNIILPGVDSDGAMIAAERIRKAIESQQIEKLGHITASIGVATFPDHTEDIDELMEITDQAMYLSKRNGRNKVSLAVPVSDVSWQEIAIETFVSILSEHRIPLEKSISDKLCEKLETINVGKDVLFSVSDKLSEMYNPQHEDGMTKAKVLLATSLAKRFDLSKEDTDKLKIAILLYDIGNLMIPKSILQKQGPLTDEELQSIKQHPIIAARDILKPISNISGVLDIVEHHHENWDGSGYPGNVAGSTIPLASQIVLIIDSYFALTEQRPYRNAMSKEEALDVIRDDIGKKWSKNLVNEFVSLIETE
ncbi:diguanylate cyclase [bacterium]|nr:diguanylate cyclase [bacterium]